MLAAQTRPPADSLRPANPGGGALRALAVLQSFQMANTPELAAAVAGILSDTNAHMKMGPRRAVTAADSSRAAEIVKTARDGLGKDKTVTDAEHEGYVKFLPWLDQPIY